MALNNFGCFLLTIFLACTGVSLVSRVHAIQQLDIQRRDVDSHHGNTSDAHILRWDLDDDEPATTTINVCQGEKLDISCSGPKRVKIVFANYGRLDPSKCPGFGSGSTKTCKSPKSESIVQSICAGRKSCQIPVTSSFFEGDECVGADMYLSVTFYCQEPTKTQAAGTIERYKRNHGPSCPTRPVNCRCNCGGRGGGRGGGGGPARPPPPGCRCLCHFLNLGGHGGQC